MQMSMLIEMWSRLRGLSSAMASATYYKWAHRPPTSSGLTVKGGARAAVKAMVPVAGIVPNAEFITDMNGSTKSLPTLSNWAARIRS